MIVSSSIVLANVSMIKTGRNELNENGPLYPPSQRKLAITKTFFDTRKGGISYTVSGSDRSVSTGI